MITLEEKRAIIKNRSLWPKCERCETPIPYSHDLGFNRWQNRKYCSKSCSSRNRVYNRKIPYEEIIADESKWPKCQRDECGKPIAPWSDLKRNKVGQWFRRRFCSLDCSRQVVPVEVARARHLLAEIQIKSVKKVCKKCGCTFARPKDMKPSTWHNRRLCGNCSKAHTFGEGIRLQLGTAEGAPIKPGFYVFEFGDWEKSQPRVNAQINCMDPVMKPIRDRLIDDVIEGMK